MFNAGSLMENVDVRQLENLERFFYLSVKFLIRKKLIFLRLGYKILVAIYSSEIKVRHETRYETNIFYPLMESMTD